MLDLSDLYKLRDTNGLFTLWVMFINSEGYGNTLKCGNKLGVDIYRFYQFFRNNMFNDCQVVIGRGMKKDSFIITIKKNVASSY